MLKSFGNRQEDLTTRLYFDSKVRRRDTHTFSVLHMLVFNNLRLLETFRPVCHTSRCQVGNVCSVSSQNTKVSGTTVLCTEDRLNLDLNITLYLNNQLPTKSRLPSDCSDITNDRQ
jgi:hypothetical protein